MARDEETKTVLTTAAKRWEELQTRPEAEAVGNGGRVRVPRREAERAEVLAVVVRGRGQRREADPIPACGLRPPRGRANRGDQDRAPV